MSDDTKPAEDNAQEPTSQATPETETPELPEEWKPEPREWNWKDVFTAPMLAFKPKCMLISLVTIVILGAYGWGTMNLVSSTQGIPVLGPVLCWASLAIGAVIFGIGASLVSIFYKADLLDDEFLSLGEALGQFKGRCKAAIMVPLFMIGVLAGFHTLIYAATLVSSIPYVGGFIYAILYPLGWLLSLFTILLSIGITLSIFVGPAVVAVRKHGWFDNVIDTFEAVGTKPHQLVSNLAITLILVAIAYSIPQAATVLPYSFATSTSLPGDEVAKVERGSEKLKEAILPKADCANAAIRNDTGLWGCSLFCGPNGCSITATPEVPAATETAASEEEANTDDGGVHKYGSGIILLGWKLLILAGLTGYLLNVFLAGGMLTYLAIREDDYWDDEDLEDLDKLAKELEEEAKREAEAAGLTPAADETDADKASAKEEAKESPADQKDEESTESASEKEAPAEEEKPQEDNTAKAKSSDENKDAASDESPDSEDGEKSSDDADENKEDDKK